MKKIVYLMLIGCLVIFTSLFSFASSTSAAASVSYTLYIDGKVSPAKFPTVMENNSTLVPMKSVLTELNYTTTVNNQTKAITAKNSAGSIIIVKVGSKKAKINGSDMLLPASVKTMNGTTYIPLSAIKQLTGKSIGVDASQGIAWIGEKPTVADPIQIWGVTPDEVKAAAGQNLPIDEGGQGDIYLLMYQDSTKGAEELYIFHKNKLAKLVFTPIITGNEDNETFLLGVYSGMFNTVVKAYGEPTKGSVDINKETLGQYLTLLSNEGYISSEWKVGDTKIKTLIKETDSSYTISMQYVNASVETQLNAALDAIK
ncbi:hypothetical protein J2T12_002061 [Paenibacillus anaericanus]|uniref:copper amine oxidase N-terminal domain-containing protein n=1 Tax=Paenibacillus anaericanus TaxID=170367 RepID=UPI00278A35F0|nr:copper amine oxidase N-terminal domain-containing protein [Paenibacillus anaericanus]MDQ0088651.1 hypothetical protein [Paenibacillus anaericanus]